MFVLLSAAENRVRNRGQIPFSYMDSGLEVTYNKENGVCPLFYSFLEK
jgi:hypothetical protein